MINDHVVDDLAVEYDTAVQNIMISTNHIWDDDDNDSGADDDVVDDLAVEDDDVGDDLGEADDDVADDDDLGDARGARCSDPSLRTDASP